MTLKEIRDVFLMRYKRLSQQRQQPFDSLNDAEISFYISAAQQDIQRRIGVVETSTSITLGTISNLYALPASFGKQKHAYIGDSPLDEIGIVEAERLSIYGDASSYYAIKVTGHTAYILCPISSGTLTIVYYPDLGYYQPSLGSSQTWGSFNGVVYSGNAILPDRYNMAIIYNMLSNIFPDFLALYEKELKSLRESRQFSTSDTLGYNLGGIEEGVLSGASITSSTTTISSIDAPSKRLRLRADDLGTYSVELDYGWSTTPTIVNSVSSIVITSGDSEFTNYTKVSSTNEDFTWSQTGSSIITILPDPASGWGGVEIIIEIFD